MKKIALVGAGCVGKTTLFEALKTDFPPDRDNAYVEEAARQYFSEHDLTEAERFSLANQSDIQIHTLAAEQEAASLEPRLIVCDRSVLDACVYVAATGDEEGGELLLNRVRTWIPTYTGIYVLDPADVPFQSDLQRREDVSMRAHLHETFLGFFALHDIPFELLVGSLDDRMNRVKEML